MNNFGVLIKRHWLLIVIWVITISTQTLPLTMSRILPNGDLQISSTHDSLWHLSLIAELDRQFPPQHPGLAGEPLRNYHYVSDIFLTGITKLGLSPWVVYYRIAPIIVSSLFVLTSFWLSKIFHTKKFNVYLSTVLIIFGGSLGYLVPFWGLGDNGFSNAFMLDPPFEMLTNIHTILGFSLFLAIVSLFIYANQRKANLFLFLVGILTGLLYGIKAYGSLILLVSLGVAGLWEVFLRKKTKIFKIAFLPAAIVFALFYFATSSDSAGLVWSPGWLLSKMIEDGNRLNGLTFIAARLPLYEQNGEWVQLTLVYLVLFGIYLVGNLGIRVFGLLDLFKNFKKFRSMSVSHVFMTTIIGLSLVMPVLFFQASSAYNVVQFGQYGLLILSLYTVLWFDSNQISRQKNKLMLALLIMIGVFTSLQSVYRSIVLKDNGEILPKSQVLAFDYLKKNTLPTSIILTHPDSINNYFMYIPGIAERRAYFSGSVFADLTGIDASLREERMREFFDYQSDMDNKIDFLEQTNIDYIYLENTYLNTFELINQSLKLDTAFSNQAVTIYAVH